MAGDAEKPRRVSKYEHAFRAGRGEPVELVEAEHDEATLEQLTAPATPAVPPPPAAKAPAGKK